MIMGFFSVLQFHNPENGRSTPAARVAEGDASGVNDTAKVLQEGIGRDMRSLGATDHPRRDCHRRGSPREALDK